MRFINKNAYIQTAIFGTGFCTSAKEAFFLILRNAARIAAITCKSTSVFFLLIDSLAHFFMAKTLLIFQQMFLEESSL